ncbi:hypothetical protein D3C77_680930 [compost metagenome]
MGAGRGGRVVAVFKHLGAAVGAELDTLGHAGSPLSVEGLLSNPRMPSGVNRTDGMLSRLFSYYAKVLGS